MSNKVFKRFSDLARKAEISRGTKDSIDWFTKRIRKGKPIKNIEVITDGFKPKLIEPGGMYVYAYDPKTKEKLPFYDMFPLIICLSIVRGGWYGLNVHYLPPSMRARILWEVGYGKMNLAKIAKALTLDPRTKPAMKRYLFDHCRSTPKYIPKSEWEIAIQLPFENFVNADNKKVWRDSRSKM